MLRAHSLSIGVPAIAGLMLFLTSCSTFESSRKIDMSPFAQNAVTMFSEAAKVSSPYQFSELRSYLDTPELLELRKKAIPILEGLKSLIMYSNQLVALNNAQMTEQKKNGMLADYILEARRHAIRRGNLEGLGISEGLLDSVIVSIRSAPTYLEAIDAASPLVDAIVFAMTNGIEEISSSVPAIVLAFDRRIESDQAEQKRNLLELRDLQARFHHAAALLFRARMGEPRALVTLLMVDPSLREYLNPRGEISWKNWQMAEDVLATRLERINLFMNQLLVEAKIYRAKQQELLNWRVELEEKIKIARNTLMVWAQSHHNLGKGVPVPPLIDLGGIAGGLAEKVLPIP